MQVRLFSIDIWNTVIHIYIYIYIAVVFLGHDLHCVINLEAKGRFQYTYQGDAAKFICKIIFLKNILNIVHLCVKKKKVLKADSTSTVLPLSEERVDRSRLSKCSTILLKIRSEAIDFEHRHQS